MELKLRLKNSISVWETPIFSTQDITCNLIHFQYILYIFQYSWCSKNESWRGKQGQDLERHLNSINLDPLHTQIPSNYFSISRRHCHLPVLGKKCLVQVKTILKWSTILPLVFTRECQGLDLLFWHNFFQNLTKYLKKVYR